MRIQVNIDDELLQAAVEASGTPDSAAAIEKGLRVLIVLSLLDELCFILPPDSEDPPFH